MSFIATEDFSVNSAVKWRSLRELPERGTFMGRVRDRFGEYALGPLRYNAKGVLVRLNRLTGRENPLAEGITLIGWKPYSI